MIPECRRHDEAKIFCREALNERVDYSVARIRVTKLQVGQFLQQGSDGFVMDGAGHAVNSDRESLGALVWVDVGGRNEEFSHKGARLLLLVQGAAHEGCQRRLGAAMSNFSLGELDMRRGRLMGHAGEQLRHDVIA